MTMLYDKSLKKKATNVSINSELLEKAKQNNINLSATLEKSLEAILLEKEKMRWEEENKISLEIYNQNVQRLGTFSDTVRSF
jgi:antitoxin CcdA